MPTLSASESRVLQALCEWRFTGRQGELSTSYSRLENVPHYILSAEVGISPDEALAVLDKLKARGLVRYVGPHDVGCSWTLPDGRTLRAKLCGQIAGRPSDHPVWGVTVTIKRDGAWSEHFNAASNVGPTGRAFDLTEAGMAEVDRLTMTRSTAFTLRELRAGLEAIREAIAEIQRTWEALDGLRPGEAQRSLEEQQRLCMRLYFQAVKAGFLPSWIEAPKDCEANLLLLWEQLARALEKACPGRILPVDELSDERIPLIGESRSLHRFHPVRMPRYLDHAARLVGILLDQATVSVDDVRACAGELAEWLRFWWASTETGRPGLLEAAVDDAKKKIAELFRKAAIAGPELQGVDRDYVAKLKGLLELPKEKLARLSDDEKKKIIMQRCGFEAHLEHLPGNAEASRTLPAWVPAQLLTDAGKFETFVETLDRLAGIQKTSGQADDEPAGKVGVGISWREAKTAGEKHVKARDGTFPGVRALAKACRCSYPTMKKAVERSPYLKARRAEYEAQRPRKAREISGGGELERLIAEQEAEKDREGRQHIKRSRSHQRAR